MKIKRLLNFLVATMLLFVLSGINQPATAQCPYHCDHGYIYVSRSSGTYGLTRDKKKCEMCGEYYCVGESHVHRCPYCSESGSSSSSSSSSDDDDNATTSSTDGLYDDRVGTKGEFADMPDMAIHQTGLMPYDSNPSDDQATEGSRSEEKKKKKSESNDWIWGLVIAGGVVFFLWKK